MRFEHGRLRNESSVALTALQLQLLLLLLRCCCVCCCDDRSHCLLLRDDGREADCGLLFCDAHEPPADCNRTALDALRRHDERAREAVARFGRLLDRYDCENANSVSWTCEDCEEAYKQWVCAMYMPPLLLEGEGVKPCRYICRLVEQRCPYFHPSVKDQYAGERVFKCIDPDIPDLEDIQEASSYGPPNRCYCPQHLGAGAAPDPDPECRLLTPTQLRRRPGGAHRSGSGCPAPPLLPLLAALLTVAFRTRTR